MRIHYAMVIAGDMPRRTAFFRNVLEFPLPFESPHWAEFATTGATFALRATEAARREAVFRNQRDDQVGRGQIILECHRPMVPNARPAQLRAGRVTARTARGNARSPFAGS